ncbi:MAG: Gfo/Idh/MocA family oxidoreductase [Firmicutes bacterium]|jgi:predicted dehydrogenase|nr:Gfo/Idh/MocA family oxidoreductase [Bacillota bacterium]
MANLKIGFIGCGGIANQKHLPGMAQQSGVDLVAFCDLVVERAEEAARKYGTADAKVYTDYRELLADPSIYAVHVLTPNVSHSEITVAALDAGKHVLCEKPMAINSEEAERMLEARNRSGKLLTIGYQYRHFHDHAVAKKVVDEGWLGDVYYAEATYIRRRGVPTWGVFTDKSKQGGGALIDIGTHALDLTLWLMGNWDVDYVVGSSYEKLGRLLSPAEQGQNDWRGRPDPWDNKTFDVEDFAVGFVKMKNGATIHLKASWALNMVTKPGMVLLAGTKGGLDTYDGVRLNHVVAGQSSVTMVGEKVREFIPGFGSEEAPPSREHEIWVAALKGEGELFVLPEQALVVSKVLEAIYTSSQTGKPVYF